MKKALRLVISIIRIALSVCLFVGCFYCAYDYLNHYFKTPDVYDGSSFHSLPENSLDVIVLGSSHAQYSFVPSFFKEETGLYSYVLGSACQPLEVSYQMLNEALKTQHPKAVILEVFTSMPKRAMCESDSCYVIAAYQMTGPERMTTFNYLPEEKASTYYNDFLNNHNDWKYLDLSTITLDGLSAKTVMAGNGYDQISTSFGYEYVDALPYAPENWWRAGKGGKYDEEIELDEMDAWALNGIYDLCQKNDIRLILYKTPIDSMEPIDNAYLDRVWDWADERDIPYVDFFKKQKELGFYMWIHSDSFHAYITGANILTTSLSEFINNLDIEFSHVENDVLEHKYMVGSMSYGSESVRQERNPYKVVNRLNKGPGYTVIRYNPIYERVNMNVTDYLGSLGVYGVNRGSSCYAIVHNGEVIARGVEAAEAYINDHNVYVDNGVLILDGAEYYLDLCNMHIAYVDLNNGVVRTIKSIDTSRSFEKGWPSYDYD